MAARNNGRKRHVCSSKCDFKRELRSSYKRCVRCMDFKLKDANHFYPNKASDDDFADICIECNSEDVLVRTYRRERNTNGPHALQSKIDDAKRRVKLMQRVLREVADAQT